METIHLKTTDPVSQRLLRSAALRGIELPWERYERLQPQDGFMRLGLSCPFECMHGPCRIDPFGRGPASGICGLGRDEMVAAMLLRLCQRGAMEALTAAPRCNGASDIGYTETLAKLIGQALSSTEQPELSCTEIVMTSQLLQRPSCSYEELLFQALRLTLLTLGLVEETSDRTGAESLPCKSGYGVISEGQIRIGFTGQPLEGLVAELEQEIQQGSETSVVLLALGEWLRLNDCFMPIAATSGESELLLSSGAIHLLVAGTGTDPGILQLCDRLKIPVVSNDLKTTAGNILKDAQAIAGSSSQSDFFVDIPTSRQNDLIMSAQKIAQMSDDESPGQVVLIGGSDTLHSPLGLIPAELGAALAGNGMQVAGWGDAALWMARQDPELSEPSKPLLMLENRQGPLLAVKGLADAGRLNNLRGICYTGMRDCLEFSMALGLAYLGCRVSIATPIPIQGSPIVMDSLAQMLRRNEGQLLHFDHPVDSATLSEWFTKP